MTEGDRPPDRGRRRRAAAALTDLRKRLTGACGQFAKVEDWRGFLAQHFTPLLKEVEDVLPAGAPGAARGGGEGAADVAEPTRAGIANPGEPGRSGQTALPQTSPIWAKGFTRCQDTIRQT